MKRKPPGADHEHHWTLFSNRAGNYCQRLCSTSRKTSVRILGDSYDASRFIWHRPNSHVPRTIGNCQHLHGRLGWVICVGLAALGGGVSSPLMLVAIAITIIVGLLFRTNIGNLFFLVSLLGWLGIAIFNKAEGPCRGYFLIRGLD